MKSIRIAAALLAVATWFSAAQADPAPTLAAGDALPALALKDQHGADWRVDASTRLLLFTRDMDAGDFVKEVLATGGRETLEAAKAVNAADVSGMPGFVRNTFALPAMRKRGYPMGLDDTGKATAALPSQQGKVTLLTLDASKVVGVGYAASAAELRAALAPKPPENR